jgi:hypothetical protein
MYSNKYLLIFFWNYIQFNVCRHVQAGKILFLKKNMYSYSLSKHMYHHIYFGSYVIVILKVKTEEKRTKG